MKTIVSLLFFTYLAFGQLLSSAGGPPQPYAAVDLAPNNEYRTYDGTMNNIANPNLGAVGTDLRRIAMNAFEDGISIPRGGMINSVLPNARNISNQVFLFGDGNTNPQNARLFTALATFFGQFQDHDFSLTPEELPLVDFSVPVPPGDPQFDPTAQGGVEIIVDRFEPQPNTGAGTLIPRANPNTITGLMDLSNVYGSDIARNTYLRAANNEDLNTTGMLPATYLPFNDQVPPEDNANPTQILAADQLHIAGDVRVAENPALAVYHTFWVRAHNTIAAQLRTLPNAPMGNVLFEEARRRNIAIMENVMYTEWFPQFLGTLFPAYAGYNAAINPSVFTEASNAVFRFGHTMLTQTVFRRDQNNNTIVVGPQNGDLQLQNGFFSESTVFPSLGGVFTDNTIEAYLNGFLRQTQNEIDIFAVNAVRNTLFGTPGQGGLDLMAINIQRGRELGIPDYNTVRVALNLGAMATFNDVSSVADTVMRLNIAYPNGISECDLWVCGLAEDHTVNANVGELFGAILTLQFLDLRNGDRFWFENSQFSDADLMNTIYPTTISDVIIANSDPSLLTSAQCFGFGAQDGCTIGSPAIPAQYAASTPATNTFIFNIVEKSVGNPNRGIGNRFGYTVGESLPNTNGGEAAEITIQRGVQYTFTSDASCSSRLFLSTTPVGGLATPVAGQVGDAACVGSSFTFTPTASTPNTIYYGSLFQMNAGGVINVQDDAVDGAGIITVTVSLIAALLALFL